MEDVTGKEFEVNNGCEMNTIRLLFHKVEYRVGTFNAITNTSIELAAYVPSVVSTFFIVFAFIARMHVFEDDEVAIVICTI